MNVVFYRLFQFLFIGLGALVFFLVPQVRNIWWSSPPPLDALTSRWGISYFLFGILYTFGIVFLLVSAAVVPLPSRVHTKSHNSGPTNWFRIISEWLDHVVSRPVRTFSAMPDAMRVALGILGIVVVATHFLWGPTSASSERYLLGGAFCTSACLWCGMAGVWLLFVRKGDAEPGDLDSFRKLVVVLVGRALIWIAGSYLFGEILWLFAIQGQVVSFRAYSLWMILHLWGILTVVGGSCDYIASARPRAPVRIIALLVIIPLVMFRGTRPNSDVIIGALPAVPAAQNNTAPATPLAIQSNTYQQLELRLREIPEGQPVILIAASGGGSRAAIFTSLVYEFLARTKIPAELRPAGETTDRNWANNIALISSVSGGSLATARFASNECKASVSLASNRFTSQAELIDRVIANIDDLVKVPLPDLETGNILKDNDQAQSDDDRQLDEAVVKDHQDAVNYANAIRNSLQNGEWQKSSMNWLVDNQLSDEMGMNFMAPILRGVSTLSLYRGDALAEFWKETFHWQGIVNHHGIGMINAGQSNFARPEQPAIIFNACEAQRGSRLAIGFPPLPDTPFLRSDTETAIGRELAHLYPRKSISIELSRAVRFSSNFPWGFEPAILEGLCVHPDGKTHLDQSLIMDGGVSDNTGIDTLVELLKGMTTKSNTEGQKLLRLLQRRLVVLFEIDSGAKPTPPGTFQQLFPVVLDPVNALNNASYTNSVLRASNYINELEGILGKSSYLDGELDSTTRGEISAMRSNASPRTFHIQVLCNHFSIEQPDTNAVMTAWTLSPDEKANVVARFVLAIDKLQKDLVVAQNLQLQLQREQREMALRLPDLASVRLRDEVKDATEFVGRLANVLADPTLNTLDDRAMQNVRKAILPYQNAVQQLDAIDKTLQDHLDSTSGEPMSNRQKEIQQSIQQQVQGFSKLLQDKVPEAGKALIKHDAPNPEKNAAPQHWQVAVYGDKATAPILNAKPKDEIASELKQSKERTRKAQTWFKK